MKTWIKAYTQWNRDPDILSLTWEQRGIWMALLLLAADLYIVDEEGTPTGELDTVARTALRIGCDAKTLQEALRAFTKNGLAEVRGGVIVLCHYAAEQSPAPSHRRSAQRDRQRAHRAAQDDASDDASVRDEAADASQGVASASQSVTSVSQLVTSVSRDAMIVSRVVTPPDTDTDTDTESDTESESDTELQVDLVLDDDDDDDDERPTHPISFGFQIPASAAALSRGAPLEAASPAPVRFLAPAPRAHAPPARAPGAAISLSGVRGCLYAQPNPKNGG